MHTNKTEIERREAVFGFVKAIFLQLFMQWYYNVSKKEQVVKALKDLRPTLRELRLSYWHVLKQVQFEVLGLNAKRFSTVATFLDELMDEEHFFLMTDNDLYDVSQMREAGEDYLSHMYDQYGSFTSRMDAFDYEKQIAMEDFSDHHQVHIVDLDLYQHATIWMTNGILKHYFNNHLNQAGEIVLGT